MANELYTRTNQKMYFTGLALDRWRQAVLDNRDPGCILAERETSLFHLYGALLGLCHEILGFYRSPAMELRRVEKILTRATLEQMPCPELAELLDMVGDPSSWLAVLLQQYGQLFQPPRPVQAENMNPPETVLADDLLRDIDELARWRQQLKALILRFRESMTEW